MSVSRTYFYKSAVENDSPRADLGKVRWMTVQVKHIMLKLHQHPLPLLLLLLGQLALQPEGEGVEVGLEEVQGLLGDAHGSGRFVAPVEPVVPLIPHHVLRQVVPAQTI